MIQITQKARQRIQTLQDDQEKRQGRRIAGVQLVMHDAAHPDYTLAFIEEGKQAEGDVAVNVEGITLFMASRDASFLSDVQIDFISNLQQTGFKVENPKGAPPLPTAPDESPNAQSPEYQAVKRVLDTEINPGVAGHGGYVSLLDVKDHVAYIRMGGGCQGCGMADVTMRQGVVVAIKKAVPDIIDVLDTTDHGGGKNPYYTGH